MQLADEIAVFEHQLECWLDSTCNGRSVLLYSSCALPKTKQESLLTASMFWWNLFTSRYHPFYISILIPGNDAWWSEFNNWGFLQEWPRLQVSLPRQGPDRRGLPELQSTVPVWQIWYVPHAWKPDQGKAEVLSSADWLLSGVRTIWVISQPKISAGLLTLTQIKQLKVYLRKNSWALT